MTFYKTISTTGEVESVLMYGGVVPVFDNPLIIEIAEDEYQTLKAELQARFIADNEETEQDESENISGDEFMQLVEAVL